MMQYKKVVNKMGPTTAHLLRKQSINFTELFILYAEEFRTTPQS